MGSLSLLFIPLLAFTIAVQGRQAYYPTGLVAYSTPEPHTVKILNCKKTGRGECTVKDDHQNLLGVRSNEIIVIPSFDLDRRDITTMNFTNLRLSYLPSSIFEEYKRLQHFTARNCSLRGIANLKGAWSLKALIVKHNKNLVQLDGPIFLKEATYLKMINLEHNNITTIHTRTFDYCSNEELTIRLSFNRLREVPANVFPPTLRKLFLNENMIVRFGGSSVFLHMGNLEVLDLSDNLIEFIHRTTFLGLTKLNWLNLASNEIMDILPGTFIDCQNLRFLLLYGNRIKPERELRLRNEELYWQPHKNFTLQCQPTHNEFYCTIDPSKQLYEHVEFLVTPLTKSSDDNEISSGPWIDRWKITKIEASHNRIGAFPYDVLQYCPTLRKLSLVNCSIFYADHIVGNSHIESIVISHNNLTSLSGNFFTSNVPQLAYLDLSHNQIKSINENAFLRLNGESVTLNLMDNLIEEIKQKTFTNIHGLKMLSLRHNRLTDIKYIFVGNNNLEELDLSFNFIRSIHKDDFRHLPRITKIHLERNEINTISPDAFSQLPRINYLDLRTNFLHYNKTLDLSPSLWEVRLEQNGIKNLGLSVPFEFMLDQKDPHLTKIFSNDPSHRGIAVYHSPLHSEQVNVVFKRGRYQG